MRRISPDKNPPAQCGRRRGFACVNLRELCVLLVLIAGMAIGFDRVQHGLEFTRPSESEGLPSVHGLVIDDAANELWVVRQTTGITRHSLPTLAEQDFLPLDRELNNSALQAAAPQAVFACTTNDGAVEVHIDGRKVVELPDVIPKRGNRHQPHGAVAVSQDGSVIVAATSDGALHRWVRREGQLQHDVQRPRVPLERIALHRDGRSVAMLSERTHVGIWNLERREWEGKWETEHPYCSTLVWSADGSRLATAGSDSLVCVWDVRRGALLWKQAGDILDPAGAAFSPCGRWLVTGGFDNRVRLWDANTGALVTEYAGHTRPVRVFAWTADSRTLYSSGLDGWVRAWESPVVAQ